MRLLSVKKPLEKLQALVKGSTWIERFLFMLLFLFFVVFLRILRLLCGEI